MTCAWCLKPLDEAAPVAFVLSQTDERYEWSTEGTVVAAATLIHGLWQIVDARGRHVVTLMPLSGDDRLGVALVGPSARLLGTIQRDEDGASAALATDDGGEIALAVRSDGPTACHVVDRFGDVVAVASWGDDEAATDLLVTATGTRQPLGMVFGLVLANELDRQDDPRLA